MMNSRKVCATPFYIYTQNITCENSIKRRLQQKSTAFAIVMISHDSLILMFELTLKAQLDAQEGKKQLMTLKKYCLKKRSV